MLLVLPPCCTPPGAMPGAKAAKKSSSEICTGCCCLGLGRIAGPPKPPPLERIPAISPIASKLSWRLAGLWPAPPAAAAAPELLGALGGRPPLLVPAAAAGVGELAAGGLDVRKLRS
jgi:hypothetical protein